MQKFRRDTFFFFVFLFSSSSQLQIITTSLPPPSLVPSYRRHKAITTGRSYGHTASLALFLETCTREFPVGKKEKELNTTQTHTHTVDKEIFIRDKLLLETHFLR